MELRKSKLKDVEEIISIIKGAQDYLREKGIDQWQNGYPNSEAIKNDIVNEESYVLVDYDKILATMALSFRGEATYSKIYEGQWLTNNRYAVIHRIAVNQDFKKQGLASIVLKRAEKISSDKGCLSIRIDTHKENIAMINFIEKSGFEYCGIIYLKDGNERMAFEKVMDLKRID